MYFKMIFKHEWYQIILLSLYMRMTLQGSTSYYTAAVVEYHPVRHTPDALQAANTNVENYNIIIKKAKNFNVDIIVFPESGITSIAGNKTVLLSAASVIPDPSNLVTPCTSPNDVKQYLVKLSCAAQEYQMYIVVNLHEKVNCLGSENCDDSEFIIYNTNVVFDRSGTVIARYRKYNLFEVEMIDITKPSVAELSIFTTDFNVTFGQFICFDILYKTPALTLVRQNNITDIIFSTHWFSELPFLTSLQYQFGFSYANDVNFLGSGLNYPSTSSKGSGIFIGREGFLGTIWEDESTNALLIADVPKVLESGVRNLSTKNNPVIVYKFSEDEIPTIDKKCYESYIYDDFSPYTTELLPSNTMNYNKTLCNNGLCCDFTIDMTFDSQNEEQFENYYRYRLAAFKGIRKYGYDKSWIEVCSIIPCLNDTLQSCRCTFGTGINITHATTFVSIKIVAVIDDVSENTSYVPTILATDTNLINVNAFSYNLSKQDNDTYGQAELTLTEPQKKLSTFGIYGRNFGKDGKPEVDDISCTFSENNIQRC